MSCQIIKISEGRFFSPRCVLAPCFYLHWHFALTQPFMLSATSQCDQILQTQSCALIMGQSALTLLNCVTTKLITVCNVNRRNLGHHIFVAETECTVGRCIFCALFSAITTCKQVFGQPLTTYFCRARLYPSPPTPLSFFAVYVSCILCQIVSCSRRSRQSSCLGRHFRNRLISAEKCRPCYQCVPLQHRRDEQACKRKDKLIPIDIFRS